MRLIIEPQGLIQMFFYPLPNFIIISPCSGPEGHPIVFGCSTKIHDEARPTDREGHVFPKRSESEIRIPFNFR